MIIYLKFLQDLSLKINFIKSEIILEKYLSIALYYLANKNLALFMRIIRFACRIAIFENSNNINHEHFVRALYELPQYQHITTFLSSFKAKNYELIKPYLLKEKVDWRSIDEYVSS